MGFFKKLLGGADQINEYFCDAVVVFVETSDPTVRLAAVAAAKVAAGAQRASMVNYLRVLAADANSAGMAQATFQLNQLADEISLRDWSTADAANEKRALKALNTEYCAALDSFDGSFFRREFPNLFQ